MGACFFLALINTYILKLALRKSFESSRISEQLLRWISVAAKSMEGLDKDDRGPIRDSISTELTRRLKKYHSKRMLSESLFSISAVIVYASIYLIFINHSNLSKIEFSYLELIVGSVSTLLCFFCHRNSIRYALSRVVPLQVCLTAMTGELAFSIDAD
ncbi:conserved hypothetical protein [Cupriavidus necator H16]|uniref:Uncharacterized protein n=1 Tax=Cupriavidus necator (strain ATCC 17699 / DSM 428 / KCTC 22496 / NCIMB 10442 / H16 / Stanier 337) TaxID=381666 RepID=Q0KFQ7_CUPNH|nr:conserved hypothetical protein [Cupriavidus necator H16]